MINAYGLEGVEVADTRLSLVDGAQGQLLIAGFPVADLGTVSFEETVGFLLCDERRPAALGEARTAAFDALEHMGSGWCRPNSMDALRACTAQLDGDSADEVIIAAVGTFSAAWWRHINGQPPISPDPSLSHAADVLRMTLGRDPSPSHASALDTYYKTVCDHGMNASTFTARVIASTDSDPVSAVVGAIGALKGRLHGGAPGPVLDMLDAIGTAEGARPWLVSQLQAGQRIMGMGHRVYRVRDPRAAVLQEAAASLQTPRVAMAQRVEKEATALLAQRHPTRPLRANVEFYTAVLLEAVGLERRMFTPTFASGRVAGWCAHIREQKQHGRLIRPKARFVGEHRRLTC